MIHVLYIVRLCETLTVFVFSLCCCTVPVKLGAITVKAAAGTFLLFLVLFAGTREAKGQTVDRLAYQHRRTKHAC